MITVAALLYALPSALAGPVTLTHSGRVLDTTGTPISTQVDIDFILWDAATNGELIHTEEQRLTPADGYYTAILGGAGDLLSSELATSGMWIEVIVDDTSLGRSPVGFVPLAAVAESVVGGTADVSEVRIDGTPVIDSSRNVDAVSVTTGDLDVNGATTWANFDDMFTRITVFARINSGADATWIADAACPANTTLVTWGIERETQFWGGGTSHWYSRCLQQGNGIRASLYTERGYIGHGLYCWGLCVRTQ